MRGSSSITKMLKRFAVPLSPPPAHEEGGLCLPLLQGVKKASMDAMPPELTWCASVRPRMLEAA
jgi:hypothetical protein